MSLVFVLLWSLFWVRIGKIQFGSLALNILFICCTKIDTTLYNELVTLKYWKLSSLQVFDVFEVVTSQNWQVRSREGAWQRKVPCRLFQTKSQQSIIRSDKSDCLLLRVRDGEREIYIYQGIRVFSFKSCVYSYLVPAIPSWLP